MSWDGYFALGLVFVVFAGLATNRAPDALLIGSIVVCTLVGILTPEEAFAGAANAGMLTVGALFVVAAALRETGALEALGAWLLGRARTEQSVMLRMAASVTPMSAFLNNTPIVAMFIPVVINWCKRNRTAPSRLLLPLSYLTILGGTCTLIGTSTNLVVDGLLREEIARGRTGLEPLHFFELGLLGVPYAAAGFIYLFVAGRWLLPSRKDMLEQLADTSREYLANMKVIQGCRLIGQTVEVAGLRNLPGLYLSEITRDDRTISPVRPDQVLEENDMLTFTGVVSTIVDLERIPGLVPVIEEDRRTEAERRRESMLCEAVVSSASPCLDKTIRDADFRALYNAVVVAVHRGGERIGGKVGDIVLRQGDTLLLQTGPHFARAHRNSPDFLLVSGVEDSRPIRSDKAAISLVLLALLILLMATGIVDIVVAAFLVAALMVLTRCISVSDARQSVDWQTLITIAAAFGLAKALDNAGVVEFTANSVVSLMHGWGPIAVLVGFYLITSIITEVVTNNAAAAVMFPFALAIADQLGVDSRPFLIAVTFAASASFVTPIGYQTNLMVYGPGGYRFTDYVKLGLPLNVMLMIVAAVLIPLIWPF